MCMCLYVFLNQRAITRKLDSPTFSSPGQNNTSGPACEITFRFSDDIPSGQKINCMDILYYPDILKTPENSH